MAKQSIDLNERNVNVALSHEDINFMVLGLTDLAQQLIENVIKERDPDPDAKALALQTAARNYELIALLQHASRTSR